MREGVMEREGVTKGMREGMAEDTAGLVGVVSGKIEVLIAVGEKPLLIRAVSLTLQKIMVMPWPISGQYHESVSNDLADTLHNNLFSYKPTPVVIQLRMKECLYQ